MRQLVKVLAVVVAFGALFSACDNEEYFCDDTGCYYCDGFGCRDAGHTYPDCEFGYQCADDQLCTELGCVDECAADIDCPEGTVCTPVGEGSICLRPTDEVPPERPEVCETDADCGDDGFCASDGRCLPNDGEFCDDGHPCEDGLVCIDFFCVLEGADGDADGDVDADVDADADGDVDADADVDPRPDPECRASSECSELNGDGWECVDGLCKLPCVIDAQCGEGCHCGADGYCSDPDA